jgi:hypothetical protein
MSLLDKLSAGAERAAKEAEKAFDKGKAKVGELQLEMQMDSKAKKLGYLVFDFYRGRQVDQDERQRLLDELSRLEDQLIQARAEAAAKAQAAAKAHAASGGPRGEETGSPRQRAPESAQSAAESAQEATPESESTWPQADA